MWMNDPDGDGWGSPTAETLSIPQLNIAIMWVRFQSSVPGTQNYVKRVVKQWIDIKLTDFVGI
jgi:hypothetical protein